VPSSRAGASGVSVRASSMKRLPWAEQISTMIRPDVASRNTIPSEGIIAARSTAVAASHANLVAAAGCDLRKGENIGIIVVSYL
jgi:hypothetical protein